MGLLYQASYPQGPFGYMHHTIHNQPIWLLSKGRGGRGGPHLLDSPHSLALSLRLSCRRCGVSSIQAPLLPPTLQTLMCHTLRDHTRALTAPAGRGRARGHVRRSNGYATDRPSCTGTRSPRSQVRHSSACPHPPRGRVVYNLETAVCASIFLFARKQGK